MELSPAKYAQILFRILSTKCQVIVKNKKCFLYI